MFRVFFLKRNIEDFKFIYIYFFEVNQVGIYICYRDINFLLLESLGKIFFNKRKSI